MFNSRTRSDAFLVEITVEMDKDVENAEAEVVMEEGPCREAGRPVSHHKAEESEKKRTEAVVTWTTTQRMKMVEHFERVSMAENLMGEKRVVGVEGGEEQTREAVSPECHLEEEADSYLEEEI